MMISYGVFQERNTRLTCNVEYDLWELLYMGWCVTNKQYYRLVYMATYVMNQYSMPEVMSVTSAVDYMDLNGAMEVILCQDNRVCT